MPHYINDHADMMAADTEGGKKVWFTELEKRWSEAEEV